MILISFRLAKVACNILAKPFVRPSLPCPLISLLSYFVAPEFTRLFMLLPSSQKHPELSRYSISSSKGPSCVTEILRSHSRWRRDGNPTKRKTEVTVEHCGQLQDVGIFTWNCTTSGACVRTCGEVGYIFRDEQSKELGIIEDWLRDRKEVNADGESSKGVMKDAAYARAQDCCATTRTRRCAYIYE